jgi:single-stranded-DNA-specific exonuclease
MSSTIDTRVAGVTFDNRQDVIARLGVNEQIWLLREPDNVHDANAIMVLRDNGELVGFIPHDLAVRLAPLMDENGEPWPAQVTAIPHNGQPDSILGVCVKFDVPDVVSVS